MILRSPILLVMGAMVSLALCDTAAEAQSPPTDLTELNIEEILALHIIGSSEPDDPKRWSASRTSALDPKSRMWFLDWIRRFPAA